jgi:hypothetical protein
MNNAPQICQVAARTSGGGKVRQAAAVRLSSERVCTTFKVDNALVLHFHYHASLHALTYYLPFCHCH